MCIFVSHYYTCISLFLSTSYNLFQLQSVSCNTITCPVYSLQFARCKNTLTLRCCFLQAYFSCKLFIATKTIPFIINYAANYICRNSTAVSVYTAYLHVCRPMPSRVRKQNGSRQQQMFYSASNRVRLVSVER